MPVARFKMPDGRVARFQVPDGTTPEQAQSMIAQQMEFSDLQQPKQPVEKKPAVDPVQQVVDGMSTTERFFAGAGKGIMDIGAGVGQMFDNEWAKNHIEESKSYGALTDTTAGKVGEVVGNLAATIPAMYVPGGTAASLGTRLAQGAAAGGISAGAQPVMNDNNLWDEKAKQVAGGALLGGAIPLVRSGIARVISPNASTGDAKKLIGEGVDLTPGQAAGGIAKRIEDAATSVPGVGHAINAARSMSMDSFNRAAYNRVLRPLGKRVDKNAPVGHEAIDSIGQTLSKAYDNILPKLKNIHIDGRASDELMKVVDMAAELPETQAKQLEHIIFNKLLGKISPQGRMTGEAMKEIDSSLGQIASKYGKSLDVDQRSVADAVRKTQAILRRMVKRTNPKHAKKLRAIDKAYAHLIRVERAALNARSDAEGAFTPAQLHSAAKALDPSVRKRASAKGKALMQDLAGRGAKVMPSKTANSGTADRLMVGGLAVGASGAIAPMTLVANALASAAYTPAVKRLIVAAVTKRPEMAGKVAEFIKRGEIASLSNLLGGRAGKTSPE